MGSMPAIINKIIHKIFGVQTISDWTPEEEKIIEAAVEDYIRTCRDDAIQAEIQRRIWVYERNERSVLSYLLTRSE